MFVAFRLSLQIFNPYKNVRKLARVYGKDVWVQTGPWLVVVVAAVAIGPIYIWYERTLMCATIIYHNTKEPIRGPSLVM